MQNFHNLMDFINWRIDCPFCQDPLLPVGLEKCYESNFDPNSFNLYLESQNNRIGKTYYNEKVFKLNFYDLELIINPYNNTVKDIIHKQTYNTTSFTNSSNSVYYGPYNIYHPTTIYAQNSINISLLNWININVKCPMFNCISHYGYSVYFNINLEDYTIFNILVDFESFFYYKEHKLHTVLNYLGSNKTDIDNGHTTLPLIDLDIKNPQKTIDRIEKLIIFS